MGRAHIHIVPDETKAKREDGLMEAVTELVCVIVCFFKVLVTMGTILQMKVSRIVIAVVVVCRKLLIDSVIYFVSLIEWTFILKYIHRILFFFANLLANIYISCVV